MRYTYICSFAKEVSWATAGIRPKGDAGGKSELHRAGCRITSGESDLRDSATDM